jgi:hypothetical protein
MAMWKEHTSSALFDYDTDVITILGVKSAAALMRMPANFKSESDPQARDSIRLSQRYFCWLLGDAIDPRIWLYPELDGNHGNSIHVYVNADRTVLIPSGYMQAYVDEPYSRALSRYITSVAGGNVNMRHVFIEVYSTVILPEEVVEVGVGDSSSCPETWYAHPFDKLLTINVKWIHISFRYEVVQQEVITEEFMYCAMGEWLMVTMEKFTKLHVTENNPVSYSYGANYKDLMFESPLSLEVAPYSTMTIWVTNEYP